MHRAVRRGLFFCGVILFLLFAAGLPAQAADAAPAPGAAVAAKKPALKTGAAPRHHKIKWAHAGHYKQASRKMAIRHRPPTGKPVIPPAVPGGVVIAQSAAPYPVVRVAAAGPAQPVYRHEAAVADGLARSISAAPAPVPMALSATAFVDRFLGEAFRIARAGDGAAEQRHAQLTALLLGGMDLKRILQYATHAAFQAAAPAVQEQFVSSFAGFLAEAYTPRLRQAAEFSFTSSAPRPAGAGGVTVSTTFTKPGYPEQSIDWELQPAGNSYRIVDVSMQGVSLLEIQRSSFTSVMRSAGGLDGLLAKMNARTRELASSAR